jgi:exodeoxyribonuclease VII large subunit
VADLDRRLRGALESAATGVWVEGEVSSLKAAPSGHVYFTLKDEREDACVDCVMYRTAAMRAKGVLKDGARAQVRGSATLWAPRGRMQFIVDGARLAGRGALLEALEQLKKKLADEGLFAPERKRPLPHDPRVIGVVTSASGAVIHDIARVAFRRGAARILLSPATVQGAMASQQIVAALDRLERVRDLDVIILGRGGGASDDLAAFNDEAVVRRIARCRVPIVSAVGHEVDVTLSDLAADVRASTPSQAAELVVADGAGRHQALGQLKVRLVRAMRARLAEDRMHLERASRALGDPRALVGERRQRVDDLEARLVARVRTAVTTRRDAVLRLDARLSARHPRAVLAGAQRRLAGEQARLVAAERAITTTARGRLGALAARLDALSPLSVLGRGYAIALRDDGRAVRKSDEVSPGDRLHVRVSEGTISARVEEVDS